MSFPVFAAIWSALAILIVRHRFFVVPTRLAAWAEARECRIVERWELSSVSREGRAFGWWRMGIRHWLVLEDREGRRLRALVYVAPPFPFGLPTTAPPVLALWDGWAPAAETGDGSYRAWRDAAVSEWTIRGFVLADFVLAVPALSLGMSILVIEGDSLGGVTARGLGVAATALAMGATLLAGSVGMTLRREWGRVHHLIGSGLFVLTILGAAYAIVAWSFALRPGFKAYFERPKGWYDKPDPFGDFREPIG